MNFRILAKVVVFSLVITFTSIPAYAAAQRAGNPVFPGWYADPEAIIYGDEYWIYPTFSAPYNQQLHFDCFSSKDLVNWVKHPNILTNKEIKWAKRAMWAPGVISKNGKYFLFFAANDVHPNEIGGIGVAIADNPAGPFKDHIGKPLINHIVNGAQPIDQFIFLDDDGTYYMYYGGWRHCNVVKLNSDFTGLVPFEDGLTYHEVTPDNYVEGPFMFKRNGKYYFMWSEGGWTGPDYSVAYAIADSPFGPFKREGKILKQDPAIATGAGHHSCFNIPGTDKWYIVYHRRPLTETDGNSRVTCIDEMHFDSNGKILPVKMTNEGVKYQTISGSDASSNDNTDLGIWSSFKYPEVIVVDKDNGTTEGSKLVNKMIPDLESFIKNIALGVCQTLYKSPDEVPSFETLVFELEDTEGVAYKVGNNPKIKIHMSTRYLASQYKRMGDEAITYEIAGINWHELTHAYQHTPRVRRNDRFGLVEGMADAVRIVAGFHKTRRPRPGGNWNSGYTTSGFFLQWVQDTYDKDFLYKLNQSCKQSNWSWDKACTDIVGKKVAFLWDEYQWHLQGGGKEAVARFSTESNIVGTGQAVKLTNNSFNQPESFSWSFPGAKPSSSTATEPTVKYSKPGVYDISLNAANSIGSTTKAEKAYILVLDSVDNIDNLITEDGKISCVPDNAMPGEGIDNLIDGNAQSKYCAQITDTQITYALPKPANLYVYSITSANDAPGRDPGSWTLEASNDGSNWKTIDTQSGITFTDRYQKQQFMVKGNSNKYTYYRFNMKCSNAQIFQFAELELLGAF